MLYISLSEMYNAYSILMGELELERIILHSDINSCYASIEHLYHPELHGKPVAVGGNEELRHGIILAKDEMAKKCGIKTGMTLWQARRLCPDITILEPRMECYFEFSKQVQEIYAEYTDKREPFGIDESWLDLTGCVKARDGAKIAGEINRRVREELGVTVSVGVSWNKTFAKLGSDYKKPDAVTVIDKQVYKQLVWPLHVSEMLFVGRQTTKKLAAMGINTIGEIAKAPPEILRKRLGKMGTSIHARANGWDVSPVRHCDLKPPPKSISNSTTTPCDLTCDEQVRVTLMSLAETIALRAREQGYMFQLVSISVRDASSLGWCGHQMKLAHPTDITRELFQVAWGLFKELHKWPKPIRGLGLHVSELSNAGKPEQLDMFDDFEKRDRERRLDAAIDSMRKKYGYMSIQRGTVHGDKILGSLNAYDDRVGVFHR